jgi:Hpt domain-containing protein
MIELASGGVDPVSAPPLVPIERPIDLEHLSRMTLGDRSLECELLRLFDRQVLMLTARMQQAAPAIIAASAHTLKGSARGIGAWPVARAAALVEIAAGADGADLQAPLGRLGISIAEARAAITDLLRAH